MQRPADRLTGGTRTEPGGDGGRTGPPETTTRRSPRTVVASGSATPSPDHPHPLPPVLPRPVGSEVRETGGFDWGLIKKRGEEVEGNFHGGIRSLLVWTSLVLFLMILGVVA